MFGVEWSGLGGKATSHEAAASKPIPCVTGPEHGYAKAHDFCKRTHQGQSRGGMARGLIDTDTRTAGIARVHASLLGFPVVDSRFRHPVRTSEIGVNRTGLVLRENANDGFPENRGSRLRSIS